MKIGLALSGGGIRGAAHIGVLEALEENNIHIDVVGGTSAGAIVTSLFAMGYSSQEIHNLFKHFAKKILAVNPKTFFSTLKGKEGFGFTGLATSKTIEDAIEEAAKYKKISNIKDLTMPIAMPTTDLISGKQYIFTNSSLEGDNYIKNIKIAKAVRASATFPFVFSPFEYDKYQFADGGITNNIPIDEIKKLGADKVIAIKFNMGQKKYNSIHNLAMRAIDIMGEGIDKEQLKHSDIVIDIDLKNVQVFNMNKMEFCYKEGYEQTIKQIDKIKKICNF